MMQMKTNHTGVARPQPYESGIDRMLEEFTRDLGFNPQHGEPAFQPSLDVSESESAWLVRTDLPGVELADVEVSVTGNVLTIRGEKKSEREEKKEQRRYVERTYGSFSRSLRLPADADAEHVDASFKDGVLTIRLPKVEAAKPRAIAVK